MKYCTKCGQELVDEAVVCTRCGCAVAPERRTEATDAPHMGFAVLSFFIPLVGLILYLFFKDCYPLRARSCGKGAIIGFVTEVVLTILYVVVVVALVGSIFTSIGSYGYYY